MREDGKDGFRSRSLLPDAPPRLGIGIAADAIHRVVVGVIGTAVAQQHLRNVLACLNVSTLGQPEACIHAKDGKFAGDDDIGPESKTFIQDSVAQHVSWVNAHVG